MRTFLRAIVATTLFVLPALAAAQQWTAVDAQRATQHYRIGWDHMHKEAWPEAVKEFQEAIAIDPRFALAYYALGRANMAQHRFPAAITSYLKCRELYLARTSERFTSQLDANKALDNQILEYQGALKALTGGTGPTQTRAQSISNLQNDLTRMQQARDRNSSVTMDISVPYFVPMALGSAYFRNAQLADAEREYRAAIDINSASGETHNNLAVVYMTTGRLEEAAKEIALAEKSGYAVNPGLKDELKQKMGK